MPPRSIKRRMLNFLILVSVIYLAICGLLYWSQERLLFYPERLPSGYRYQWGVNAQEVRLSTPDGAELSVLHAKAPDSRGVVIYFHGNAGSLRSWSAIATDWTRHNYDVLMPDYRGFGTSTGSLKNEAMLLADAKLVYTYAQILTNTKNIVLVGRSLGSGIATALARDTAPKLLILETPYISVARMARRQFPLAPTFLLKYPLRTDLWLPQVQSPIVLIHGTRDELIPYTDSEYLLQLVPEQATLITIQGGGHNDLSTYPSYHQALEQILQE